jgi:hypothetical protein
MMSACIHSYANSRLAPGIFTPDVLFGCDKSILSHPSLSCRLLLSIFYVAYLRAFSRNFSKGRDSSDAVERRAGKTKVGSSREKTGTQEANEVPTENIRHAKRNRIDAGDRWRFPEHREDSADVRHLGSRAG